MSMKISSETIGNRTRDLPACSALLAQLRHRLPHALFTSGKLMSCALLAMSRSEALSTDRLLWQ